MKTIAMGTTFSTKDYAGTTQSIQNFMNNSSYFDNNVKYLNIKKAMGMGVSINSSPYRGIILGSGTTPPTENDYFLSGSKITSGSIPVSISVAGTDNSSTATITLTNNTTSDVTIGEVALMSEVYFNTSGTTSSSFMIDRTVLDEPITLSANGGIGQIVYTITLS